MLIYNAKASGCTLDELMERFPGTTRKSLQDEIWVIEEMKRQEDTKLDNYSYYNVIRKTNKIREPLLEENFHKNLTESIINQEFLQ